MSANTFACPEETKITDSNKRYNPAPIDVFLVLGVGIWGGEMKVLQSAQNSDVTERMYRLLKYAYDMYGPKKDKGQCKVPEAMLSQDEAGTVSGQNQGQDKGAKAIRSQEDVGAVSGQDKDREAMPSQKQGCYG